MQLSFDLTDTDLSTGEGKAFLSEDTSPDESVEISHMKEELKEFLLGTKKKNLGAWSGSYVTINSLEPSINPNPLAHNGDKFTQEELTSIMETLFETSHDHNVIPLGDKGLKQWFIDNMISELQSRHIRQFLVKRAEKLHSKSLFQLILRFSDFESMVQKVTRKQPIDLNREDFGDQALYEDVMTSQFYYHNFNLFYKQMTPFHDTSLSYTPKVQKKVVLPQAVQSFLVYKGRNGMKQDRLDKFRYELQRYLTWSCNVLNEFKPYPIEKVPFTLFKQEHLLSYKNYLIKGIKSGRFAENGSMKHLKNIKTFFHTLHHMGYIKNDITRGIRNIQGDDYKSRYIPTDSEIEAFFSAIGQYSNSPQMDKVAFGFMLYLGFRSCELANLHWENINMSLKDVKFTAKGGKVHSLPLPSHLVSFLNEVEKQEEGLVFGVKPNPLRTELAIKYRMFTLVAGWKEASGPHQLRHTFITRLTEKGVTPKVLKRLARHESLAITSNYIHKTDDQIRDKAMNMSLPWEGDNNVHT